MRTAKRIYIRRLELDDTESLLRLRLNNREYLQPFEPRFLETHFTYEGQKEGIIKGIEQWEKDLGYPFGIFLKENNQLIGRVNLSNVVRGAWQNCTIGYFIAKEMQRKGYMTEAVTLAVWFAFEEANLHRVQAAVMPRNIGSIRVVEKVGFRYEGRSKHYLCINGVWKDHNIYALTKEDWESRNRLKMTCD
jgi:ribosomal-protein-alanine N-acetyltransferase